MTIAGRPLIKAGQLNVGYSLNVITMQMQVEVELVLPMPGLPINLTANP